MYFSKFPFTYYSINKDNTFEIVPNILRRVTIREELVKSASAFFDYQIKDTDTPEIIADKVYGDPGYFWIILHTNQILNVYDQWPLKTNELIALTSAIYGDQVNAVHHYEDSYGNWVNSNFPGASVVSNYQYEDSLNEQKRKIKILDPSLVKQMQVELETLLGQ